MSFDLYYFETLLNIPSLTLGLTETSNKLIVTKDNGDELHLGISNIMTEDDCQILLKKCKLFYYTVDLGMFDDHRIDFLKQMVELCNKHNVRFEIRVEVGHVEYGCACLNYPIYLTNGIYTVEMPSSKNIDHEKFILFFKNIHNQVDEIKDKLYSFFDESCTTLTYAGGSFNEKSYYIYRFIFNVSSKLLGYMWSIVLYYNNDGTITFINENKKDGNYIYFDKLNNKPIESFEKSLPEQQNKYDKVLDAYTQINDSIPLGLSTNMSYTYYFKNNSHTIFLDDTIRINLCNGMSYTSQSFGYDHIQKVIEHINKLNINK